MDQLLAAVKAEAGAPARAGHRKTDAAAVSKQKFMSKALRICAIVPVVWILGSACQPDPKDTTSATEGADTGDPGATAGESGSTTGGTGATTGASGSTTGEPGTTTGGSGSTTGEPSTTTGDPDSSGTTTTCEPSADEPVCSAIPVTPGGDRGCGGEELSIAGCDQLAGYEVCPNLAVHRHTAGIPCADVVDVCDPRFTCNTDEDCDPGQACLCEVAWGDDRPDPVPFVVWWGSACVYAECRTDADCPFGMRCGVDITCGSVDGLFCHTPEDGCEGDGDCPEVCSYSHLEKRWFCSNVVFCE